jgi:hypothetical protein
VKAVLPLLAALAVCPLGLWACGSPATPAPNSHQSATTPVVTTVPETATASPRPPQPEPTWTVHQTEAFSIRLPATWQAGEPDAEPGAARLPAFQQDNPELAGFLGGASSRGHPVFSAQGEFNAAGRFADNVNIRRTSLDSQGGAALPEIAATIAAQYRQLGFDVLETATGLEVGEQPSARITYTFGAAGSDGKTESLSGLQLLVAAPDDLWILTYTTTGDRFAALRSIFEESARSFTIK